MESLQTKSLQIKMNIPNAHLGPTHISIHTAKLLMLYSIVNLFLKVGQQVLFDLYIKTKLKLMIQKTTEQ